MNRREFLFGQSSILGEDVPDWSDESGASAVEYGLIGALVVIALIPAVSRMGQNTREPLICARRSMRRAQRGRKRAPRCARN
ncbi:MAG: Flp family type IVb pilin [Henriciella sp.]|nr:Flp family type IVb pilin [Henriciella sp.]